MHFGLVISVFLHAAVLGWTLLSIQSQRELRAPETEPIAVGMITPAEATKVRLGAPTAKQVETEAKETPKKAEPAKKEAAKPRPAAAAPPPPPPEPAAPKKEQKLDPIARKLAETSPAPPPASPAPDKQKDLDGAQAKAKLEADAQRRADAQRLADDKRKAEEQQRAEEKKKAEEKERAEERRRQAELKKKEAEKERREAALKKKRREAARKKKRDEERKRQQAEAAKRKQFNADRIAALLNKVPNKSAPPPSAPPDQPTKAKGPALGARQGRDKEISASERAMLNAIIGNRLKICWRLPSAGGGSDTPVVTLRWHLRPDGSLDGDPVVVERTRNDPLFQLAAEAAIRAVRECAPFPLPPDKYSVWKTVERTFDPRQML